MIEKLPPVNECLFCQRIARGEVLAVDHHFSVVRFEPLNPVAPGHMLFVPRLHVASADLYPAVTGEVFAAAAVYAQRQRVAGLTTSFNLITSAGSAATQTIEHLHVHYVPRREDDGLKLPWTGQAK